LESALHLWEFLCGFLCLIAVVALLSAILDHRIPRHLRDLLGFWGLLGMGNLLAFRLVLDLHPMHLKVFKIILIKLKKQNFFLEFKKVILKI